MCWSIEAKVTAMTVDPFSGYFAVFAVHHREKNKRKLWCSWFLHVNAVFILPFLISLILNLLGGKAFTAYDIF